VEVIVSRNKTTLSKTRLAREDVGIRVNTACESAGLCPKGGSACSALSFTCFRRAMQ
jgi:hypothetical protein